MSRYRILRKILKESPGILVVILSMYVDEEMVWRALRLGASGYVAKSAAVAELKAALQTVEHGDVYISPRVAGAVAQALRDGPRRKGTPHLTPRERDVVRLLSEGMSSKDIAQALQLSPKTVDGYRSEIMEKLGIHSVAGLVKYAIRNHLTTVGE